MHDQASRLLTPAPKARLLPGDGRGAAHAHLLAAGLAAIIFCLDAFTRADLAVAGLYGVVLLVMAGGAAPARGPAIVLWAVSCAALSLLGYAIYRARGAPPLALFHLSVSLIVLAVTTLLLLRAQTMGATAQHAEKRYRTIFDSLAIAVWEHDFSEVEAAIARLREAGVRDLRRHIGEHPDVVVAMRRTVRITDVNATALTMMGVRNKAEFFCRLSDFLPESDESFAECILAIAERRSLFQSETTVIPASGVPKQVIVALALGPDASLDRVPGSILDVSHRRALEGQILRTREELAQVQRSGALAAMSATIAHELNQPMSAIRSFADAARHWMNRVPPDLEETARALAGLTAGVDHAHHVMQRVRALVGEARIDRAEVELGGLLATTVALMRREASDAGARLVILPAGDEMVVMGDRILLKQVLVNLITNGIQAMLDVPPPRRVVTLMLERRGESAVVTVADQGPGWAGPAASRAFDSFFTTKQNGMGLGLAISRTVVERHGGAMALRHGPAGGAVIEVTLPLCADALSPVPHGKRDSGEEPCAVERFLDHVAHQP